MNDFEKWFDNADMPEQDENGNWFDLETGLPYIPGVPSVVKRAQISESAQAARSSCKKNSAIALKGSVKQKNWGEEIRAKKIIGLSAEEKSLILDSKGILNNAKFWIENRDKRTCEIVDFVRAQKSLLAYARELELQGNDAEYEKVAAEYNELTKKWGFD